MAEDPWCCSYDRRGETCPACLGEFRGAKKEHDWRELYQDEQPLLSQGYTAIMASRPGVWLVKGPGPSGRCESRESAEEVRQTYRARLEESKTREGLARIEADELRRGRDHAESRCHELTMALNEVRNLVLGANFHEERYPRAMAFFKGEST